MKKIYFDKSYSNSNHLTAWTNFDLLECLKLGAKQRHKNVSFRGVYNYEITRLDYKHINELSGVEIVNDMRDLAI